MPLLGLVDQVDRSTVHGSCRLTSHSIWFTVASWYVQMVHSSQPTAYSSHVDRCDISPPLVYPVSVDSQAPVSSTDCMCTCGLQTVPLHLPILGEITMSSIIQASCGCLLFHPDALRLYMQKFSNLVPRGDPGWVLLMELPGNE